MKKQFGNYDIEIQPTGTLISCDDGTIIPAVPHDTDSYRLTAQRLGYGEDTLKMCKEHEVMHLALAQWLEIESPTMAMLRGTLDDPLLNGLEEDAVLASIW